MCDSKTADISVIIPNWNGRDWLPHCISCLEKQTVQPVRIIVVDNGSTDQSLAWLHEHAPGIRIIEMGRNTGFAAAVNAGIRASETSFVALLNTDTKCHPNWLRHLYQALMAAPDDVGAVCGKMLQMSKPDRIENAGDIFTWQGAAEKRGHNQVADEFSESGEVFSVCAGGALYRRSFFDQAGLFDESFFAYLEDIDIGLRGHLLGYKYLYEPAAILLHQGHGSELPGKMYVRLTTANRLRLFIKNIPASLWWRHMHSFLYGQWYYLICHRRPLSSLAGYWMALCHLRSACHARSDIFRKRKSTNAEFAQAIVNKMRGPSLCQAMRNQVRSKKPTP